MFDYQDLVSYILVLYSKQALSESEAGDINIQQIVQRARKHQAVEVQLVSDLSRRNPFYSVPADSTLLQAMDVFATGIHRVAVTAPVQSTPGASVPSENNGLVGILTQSNVAAHLYPKLIGTTAALPKAQRSIKDLGLAKPIGGPIVAVNAEALVFHAMEVMKKSGVSSVPLVDHGGRLVGSCSLSDIKYVLKGFKYNMLWRTCFQFISYVRNHQGLVEDMGRDRFPVFDVRQSDTLAKAVGKMCATKAHRMWVVDDTGKLVGVVSLTDALRALMP